ncbi:MAG: elongation factor G [Verrucomicrobiota bacterium]
MTTKRHLLRNIDIIAHVDAGKTTVSEKILYFTGKIHKTIEVHEGGATMDSHNLERKHGITISSAATTVQWRDHAINIIDTPGHIDFGIDVRCALRVLDGAVVVFDAVAGVEPQTETNWRLANDHDVARIAFINKLDRAGADFGRICEEIRERLGVEPLPLQLPIGSEAEFSGMIDVLRQRALTWPQPDGREIHETDIPAELRETAETARTQILEHLANFDDEVAELFLNGETVSEDAIIRAIRRGVGEGAFVPVFGGSALKNKGVQPLLDAVVDYLPAPAESEEAPFAALVFKSAADQKFGHLSYVRVYSGELKPGETVWNPREAKRERVSHVYQMHATQKQAIESAMAGNIVALSGFKSARTGDTLCEPGHEIVLENIEVPEPVTSVVLEAVNRAEREKLSSALARMLREDPTLHLATHPETGQMLLSGMGELHLQMKREALEEEGLEVQFGAPLVAYRETLTQPCEITHRHKKQGGGPGQFAQVTIRFEPLPRGTGVEFESRISGGSISAEFIPAVERGIRERAQSGLLAGHPVVDFKATLLDGQMHSDDSSALAFQIAGNAALRLAAAESAPLILEPVMTVEVTTPGDHLGEVIGDLSRRRGMVLEQRDRGLAKQVVAEVPLAEMFGYIGDLRSVTAGRGEFSMAFAHYRQVPKQAMLEQMAAA